MEGWRELVRHRGLFHLTIILTIVTLLYMPLNALFPLMTFDHFGGGAFAAGIIEMLFGAGMLVGSLIIGALSARFSAVTLIGTGILVAGLMLAASGMLPPTAFWVFAGLSVIMGVSVPLFGAPLTAMFQTFIDPAKLGRVMSLYMTMALAVSPLGLLLAGPVAEETGVAFWFAVSASSSSSPVSSCGCCLLPAGLGGSLPSGPDRCRQRPSLSSRPPRRRDSPWTKSWRRGIPSDGPIQGPHLPGR